MGGDQVVGEELGFAGETAQAVELFLEFQQRLRAGFAHQVEDVIFGVLGSHLQLPGDVVLDDLAQVVLAAERIAEDHVVAQAGGHEDLLHPLQLPHLAEQFQLRAVIHFQQGADLGEETAFGRAGAVLEFLIALEAVHVGGRSAQVLDVAFEFGMS